ncbi:hypothetical protein M0R45_030958 [Rubus argutus]|uniref:Uncharacterized protein n=1 Tax=Rubus argutus TaxID=59490 RepID=A0AAW1WF42_RUBAR
MNSSDAGREDGGWVRLEMMAAKERHGEQQCTAVAALLGLAEAGKSIGVDVGEGGSGESTTGPKVIRGWAESGSSRRQQEGFADGLDCDLMNRSGDGDVNCWNERRWAL